MRRSEEDSRRANLEEHESNVLNSLRGETTSPEKVSNCSSHQSQAGEAWRFVCRAAKLKWERQPKRAVQVDLGPVIKTTEERWKAIGHTAEEPDENQVANQQHSWCCKGNHVRLKGQTEVAIQQKQSRGARSQEVNGSGLPQTVEHRPRHTPGIHLREELWDLIHKQLFVLKTSMHRE